MSFVHPVFNPPSTRTVPNDILRQPSGAARCTELWCKTLIPAVSRKRMGKSAQGVWDANLKKHRPLCRRIVLGWRMARSVFWINTVQRMYD